MAALVNDSGVMRFSLALERRHDDKFLGSAGVEVFDRRDGEFWPLVRVPVVKVAAHEVMPLVDALKECCAGSRPGVTMHFGEANEIALNLGPQNGGGFLVEIGFDLSVVLREHAGVVSEPGRELSLFRFSTSTEQVVKFGDQLRAESAA